MPQQRNLDRQHIYTEVIHTFAIALAVHHNQPEEEIISIAQEVWSVTHIPLPAVLECWCNAERILVERHGETKTGRKGKS